MAENAIAMKTAKPNLLSEHDLDDVRGGLRVGDFYTGSGMVVDRRPKGSGEPSQSSP